ncbi:hypothetical protein J6590_088783 [Homalodisca vitripennis]|nr:hypothetical protein J6590_088783 [Homalodisca vitripennis]
MFQNMPSPTGRLLATCGCPGGRASVALSLSSFQTTKRQPTCLFRDENWPWKNDVVDRAIKGRTVSSAGDRPKWRQQLTFEETLTQRPRDLSKLDKSSAAGLRVTALDAQPNFCPHPALAITKLTNSTVSTRRQKPKQNQQEVHIGLHHKDAASKKVSLPSWSSFRKCKKSPEERRGVADAYPRVRRTQESGRIGRSMTQQRKREAGALNNRLIRSCTKPFQLGRSPAPRGPCAVSAVSPRLRNPSCQKMRESESARASAGQWAGVVDL